LAARSTASGKKEGGITVNAENMRAAALKGYATATDLADYLVKKGLPFRDAHETVAHAVKLATMKGVDLTELPWPSCRPSTRTSKPMCSRR
jgi:argininosuccinate lyase